MTELAQDLLEDQEGFICDMADTFKEYSTLLSPGIMCKLIKIVVTDGLNHHMNGACTYLTLSKLFEANEDEDEEEEDEINREGFMAEVAIYHGEADEEEAPSIKESVTNDIF